MKELKKKKSTKGLLDALRRASKERKEPFWGDLAERLSKPSRQFHGVNISKISGIAQKNKGKTIVVAGKALGKGEMLEKADVGAFAFSKDAREKINRNGKAMDFWELMESKKKASEMVTVW